ncbi:glycerophosphoryl diester phosphodiesterase membrane domain-containing protein [Patulibacter americanus]|uniref:glycerophosphoryl diester phosphodiesterase membrane domain-containing protein n=1 Tax=Patulibacter americanus TaxID=588672 RepID=UPI0003B644DF|nr:glycerophosphoryl diester phosphodiesterase membrane domain-containing protein [Patulibacter americanus]
MSTPESPRPALPVGLTLDRGFALLRRHPRALLLPQLVLNVLPALFGLVLVGVGYLLLGDVRTRTEQVRESTFLGDSRLVTREVADYSSGQQVLLGVLIAIGALVFVWFLLAAYVSVVRGADRAVEGRPHLPLGRAMRESLTATPKLFGLGIVFYLGMVVVFAGLALVVVLAAQLAGALAVLVGLAAFLALVYLVVRVLLWPVVHLSEATGVRSYRRAWDLTRGRFWSVFGVLLLVGIVVSVVSTVLSLGLQLVVGGLFALDETVGAVSVIPYVVLLVGLSVITTAGFIAPVVVAYRTLAGRDTAELWQAAEAMGGPGRDAGDAAAGPPAEPGVRRWASDEPPIAGAGSGGAGGVSSGSAAGGSSERLWSGDAAERPEGAADRPGGLPAADAPADPGMDRWKRGADDGERA